MDLKKYTTYRRKVLEAERAELAKANPGITTGRLMGFDRKASVTLGVLDELNELAEWMEAQEPDYVAPMTEDEKTRWRWAMDHGFDVPADIVAQLEPA